MSDEALRAALARCESPIEKLLLVALWPDIPQHSATLTVQAQVDPAVRVDFLLERGRRRLVVEADGAPYHSSREQKAVDAARDRLLGTLGFQVVRVRGEEITKDARGAARKVWRAWRRGGRP